MVKDNHKVIRQSERKAGGESINNKIAGELPTLIDVNGWNDNTPLDSKGNINMNNKSSHQISRSIPLTIYHQNIRGLRGKANELLGQLHPSFPQVLCLTEHHMNQLELQRTPLDGFK
jgi:hypothetical protein